MTAHRLRRGLAWGAVFSLAVLAMLAGFFPPGARAAENGGVGPLTIRNQYPVALGFLHYSPESPVTRPEGTFQLRYQFSLTNTFINTQSPLANNPPVIDRTIVTQPGGLTAANFPATGYGLYIDVEAQRHQFRFNYSLLDSLELSLELAWVTFGGGFLDSKITGVEDFFGGLNKDRTYSDENRFDFYVIRDGVFLQNSSQPFTNAMQDPVIHLKWTLTQGGEVWPALGVRLSAKTPLESNPTGARKMISSGGSDWGYYLLVGKEIGEVVAHFQIGTTNLEVAPNTYSDKVRHKMFGLEFRVSDETSFILQSVSQTSIFNKSTAVTNQDFALSTQTDVGLVGFKHHGDGFLYEIGFIEDYNQQRNEADITLYFELGWEW